MTYLNSDEHPALARIETYLIEQRGLAAHLSYSDRVTLERWWQLAAADEHRLLDAVDGWIESLPEARQERIRRAPLRCWNRGVIQYLTGVRPRN